MKLSGKAFSTFLLFLFLFTCLNAGAKAATFTVTNLNDSGAGALRQAITDANAAAGADVIEFQTGIVGTINLESALPDLSTEITVNGPGAELLTVRRSSGVAYRIFKVTSSQPVVLNGLMITGGSAPRGNDPDLTLAQGGGIFTQGNLTVNKCIISGNAALASIAQGGGIYNSGFLTINDSQLLNNQAFTTAPGNPVASQRGGGIYSMFGTVTINNSSISNSGGSHAIYNIGVVSLSNSSVTNNSAGGIHSQNPFSSSSGGVLIIENSTISGNSMGSAIAVQSGLLEIRSSTVTNNQNGGVSVSCSQCPVSNSIIAGNGAGNDLAGNVAPTSSYNLIGNGSNSNLVNGQNGNIVGTTAAPVNAQLAPLGNYGGRTQTHRLLNTSPAINAGNPIDFPAIDQRGVGRPVGGTADIGAFEFNLTPHRYLPRGGLNAGYDQTFTAFSNVPAPVFSFAVSEGVLPPGLSLSQTGTNTARVFGIPADVGTFNFTITATNTEGFTISASYTLIIQAGISFAGVSGRVLSADGKPVRRAFVHLIDANGNVIKQTFTNPFGYYRFFGIQTGEAYSFKVIAKNRRFTQQNIIVNGELNDFNFIAEP
jgi:hypothetical protein